VKVDEYRKLKERVDKLKADLERQKGHHEAALERLKDLGYETIEGATEAYENLTEEAEKANCKYQKAKKEFETKWGDRL
jgi:chromosome segregation ATPase